MAPAIPEALADQSAREQEQQVKIKELKQKLADDAGARAAEQLVQGGELQSTSALTCDKYLHRWLRARSWDVDRTYASLVKHAEWRAANMPTGRVEESSIANEIACEKALIQGVDRQGRPIMIIQVRKHNGWTRYLDELERLCCYALDECVRIADQHKDTNPRGQCCVMVDLTDMGALSMDIQAIKALFALLGEHYVERLGVMYFYNPPYIFWGAWNTLSPMLPEPTRNKIRVIDPATQGSELLDNIDPAVLPKEYGGNADLATPVGKAPK